MLAEILGAFSYMKIASRPQDVQDMLHQGIGKLLVSATAV